MSEWFCRFVQQCGRPEPHAPHTWYASAEPHAGTVDWDCPGVKEIAQSVRGSGHPAIHGARVWLDEDGKHIWLEHTCTPPDGPLERTMLPWPTWRHTTDNRVHPSIHCTKCGLHFLANLTTNAPTEWAS